MLNVLYIPVLNQDIRRLCNRLLRFLHQFRYRITNRYVRHYFDFPLRLFDSFDVDNDTFVHFEPIVDHQTTVKYLYLDLIKQKSKSITNVTHFKSFFFVFIYQWFHKPDNQHLLQLLLSFANYFFFVWPK